VWGTELHCGWLTRSLGGTINRLGELHDLLARFSRSHRVQLAAEIAPVLLQVTVL